MRRDSAMPNNHTFLRKRARGRVSLFTPPERARLPRRRPAPGAAGGSCVTSVPRSHTTPTEAGTSARGAASERRRQRVHAARARDERGVSSRRGRARRVGGPSGRERFAPPLPTGERKRLAAAGDGAGGERRGELAGKSSSSGGATKAAALLRARSARRRRARSAREGRRRGADRQARRTDRAQAALSGCCSTRQASATTTARARFVPVQAGGG